MYQLKSNFLNDYNNALDRNDVDGLRGIFIDKIGDLIVHHKPELIANLRRLNITLPANTNNEELSTFITEALHSPRPNKVHDMLASMMILKDGHFMNDATSDLTSAASSVLGDKSDSKSDDKSKKDLSGEQISNVADSISKALGGIFTFAKSAVDAKKAKKATAGDLTGSVADKADKAGKESAPPPPQPKSNTAMYVGIGLFALALVVGGLWYYKSQQTSGGGASTPAPGAGGV